MAILLGVVAILCQANIAVPAANDVAFLVRQKGYIERTYAAEPRNSANYLFVAGEPVSLRVEFVNRSQTTVWLDTRGLELVQALGFQLTRRSSEGWQPVEVALVKNAEASLYGPGFSIPVEWGARFEIPPGGWLSVELSVMSPGLTTPGEYRLQATDIPYVCGPDCKVRNQVDTFGFEIAPASGLPARLELEARRAQRAIHNRSFDEAERALNAMLEMHPKSVVAYQLRGERLAALGRRQEAAAAYEAALALLVTAQDPLLVAIGPDGLQRRQSRLRQQIQRTRAR